VTADRSRLIGITVPDLNRTFHVEMVRGVSDAAWNAGYRALICETCGQRDREIAVLSLLSGIEVRGVLLLEPCSSDLVLSSHLPRFSGAVVINRDVPDDLAGQLSVDLGSGLRQVVEHLVDRGHQHLAYLGPHTPVIAGGASPCIEGSASHSPDLDGADPVQAWSAAEVRALTGALVAAGLPETAAICRTCDGTWEGGYMAARELLVERPEVDAIICASDVSAVGALHACTSLGKQVPYDVAVVGGDDALLARLIQPALTTLHVPKYEVGAMAFRMLLDRINGDATTRKEVVAQRLVVRASAP
jgi:LacI family transcriptional regulator